MAPPRDIPGYFYDDEKKKYFKILPNHVAPVGSPYSKEAVGDKAAVLKLEKSQASRRERVKRQRVQNDPRIRHPLTRLDGILGSFGPGNATSSICEYYGRSLTPSIHLDLKQFPPSQIRSQYFDVHDPTGDLLIAETLGHLMCIKRSPQSQTDSIMKPAPYQGPSRCVAMMGQPGGPVLLTNRWLAIWTAGNEIGVRVMYDEEREFYPHALYTLQGEHVNSLTGSSSGNYWAVASDTSIRIGRHDPFYDNLSVLVVVDKPQHEFVATSFQGENTIMAADRSNFVSLYDHRAGAKSRMLRVRHDGPVNALRSLKNSSQVLANGLMNTTIYDLRYSAPPKANKSFRDREPPTTPYLTFSTGARSSDRHNLGLDYYSDLNLVAIASSRKHKHSVTLYSTRTGRVVHSPLNEWKFEQSIPCLKFASLRDGTKSLLLEPTGRGLQEWCVQGLDSDENEREAGFGGVASDKGRLNWIPPQ